MKHNEVETEVLLLNIGEHTPSVFVNGFDNLCDEHGEELTGSILTDIEICRNPHNILYWEAWANVLKDVYVYKETHNGMGCDVYKLHHHNCIWLIKKDDLDKLNETQTKLFWKNI